MPSGLRINFVCLELVSRAFKATVEFSSLKHSRAVSQLGSKADDKYLYVCWVTAASDYQSIKQIHAGNYWFRLCHSSAAHLKMAAHLTIKKVNSDLLGHCDLMSVGR